MARHGLRRTAGTRNHPRNERRPWLHCRRCGARPEEKTQTCCHRFRRPRWWFSDKRTGWYPGKPAACGKRVPNCNLCYVYGAGHAVGWTGPGLWPAWFSTSWRGGRPSSWRIAAASSVLKETGREGVFLICVDITATAFCHCPPFPRKRESREFVRYGFPQTGQADSRFRGNDGAENSLSTYVKNTREGP